MITTKTKLEIWNEIQNYIIVERKNKQSFADLFNKFGKEKVFLYDDVKKEIEEIEQSSDMKYSNGKYMYNQSEKDIVLEITGLLKFRLFNSQKQKEKVKK